METFINVEALERCVQRFINDNRKFYRNTEQLASDAVRVSLIDGKPFDLQLDAFDSIEDVRNEFDDDALIEGIEADMLLALKIKDDIVELHETDVYGAEDGDFDFFANVEIREIDGLDEVVTIRLVEVEQNERHEV